MKPQVRVDFGDTSGLFMKISNILVIGVIIKLCIKANSSNIFSVYMKESSILVITVIIKQPEKIIFTDIFSPSTEAFFILVIYANSNQKELIICKFTLSLNMKVSNIPVINVITKPQLEDVL